MIEPSVRQCRLLLLILPFVILIISISSQAEQQDDNYLALSDRLLRFKRQQSVGLSSSQQNNDQLPSSAANSATVGSPADPQSSSGNPQTEAELDQPMSSLKCDFGTADSPDLCKFKIIESARTGISKELISWSLGSGKLALYQGGPLVDASDRNDTSGGYIFYETSNPYASNHSVYDQTRGHANSERESTSLIGSDYATYTKHRLTNNAEHPDFQHVSSGRVAIGAQQLAPAFMSPNLTASGPSGMCLSFQYAIQGLSAEELRVQVQDHKTERSRQIWASSESANSNWTRGEVLYSATNVHSVLFSASSPTSGSTTKDIQQRKFRGHIALDEIQIQKHDPTGAGEGPCKGHCNFDGDLCGWTNAENGQEDDFDWSFGRGSDNLFTGPARDFISSTNNEVTGSYLFTDSGYPRRPGDRAVLISPVFQPTPVNEAMCMRLAVHMFGSGIGSLAIKIRYTDDVEPQAPAAVPVASPGSGPAQGLAQPQVSRSSDGKPNNDLVIWEMAGDASNSWHQAQTSVSSAKKTFQVIIEGVVGENHLGNIAIDEISFSSGPCPTSPPVASKNYGDCTFEQSMCYWRNPDADIHLDDLDWIRSAEEQNIHGPNFDHTLKKRSGSYLKLENTYREPKSGTRAFLLSPIFQPKEPGNVQCLSFYYYMFMRSISSSGPNLGTIRVYLASNNELVPIWRLTNPISSPNWKHGRASLSNAIVDGAPIAPTKLFQIAFEGIWGDAPGGAIALDDITVFDGACDILPMEAKSVPGECTFDIDMCSWTNKTADVMLGSSDSTDSSRSPFIQSVNSASGYLPARLQASMASKRMSWQLATVDSRPVNLQDHTYKAPIGYIYVDVLDAGSQRLAFPLQSFETTVQSGQQPVVQCLSFWFAAYGRQETNQLNVYLTQASAPPQPAEDAPSKIPQLGGGTQGIGTANSQQGAASASGQSSGSPTGSASASSASSSDQDSENAGAWKNIDGKLLWSVGLKNITEVNRRKWQYGQVSLRADSNYIVRFVAFSSDGGFAIDDISYYEGTCQTRPSHARVQEEEDSESLAAPVPQKPPT